VFAVETDLPYFFTNFLYIAVASAKCAFLINVPRNVFSNYAALLTKMITNQWCGKLTLFSDFYFHITFCQERSSWITPWQQQAGQKSMLT